MTNPDLRAKAASVIRSYLHGEINNHEFADSFPRDRSDPALHAVQKRLWFHYDDLRTHHCELPPEVEMLFRRCALFLVTQLDYEWPELWHHNLAHPIARILTAQLFRSRANQKSKLAGDYAVWPFLHKADLEKAKADFGTGDVTSDEESLGLPLNRRDRLWLVILRGIDLLLTGLFLGGVGCFLWGVIGHWMWMAAV